MAEQVGKFLTELPELETPTDDDSMYIVDGSTASKKITMSNLKRVLGGNVTGTVEGASVSFSDGADGIPMEECEVTIVPTQDLHGYSKPWAGGANYNKWDEDWQNGYIGNSGQIISDGNSICSNNFNPIDENNTYYGVNPTGKSLRVAFYDSTQTWISNQTVNNGTFTPPANAEYFKLSCYNYGVTYNDDIAINYPSTVTDYSPYANICPISGHTDVTITVASTSGGSGDDTTVSLGRTVYGGTLDVTTGELTVTKADVNLSQQNLSYNKFTTGTSDRFYVRLSNYISNVKIDGFNNIESDYFEAKTQSTNEVGTAYMENGYLNMNMTMGQFADATAFKTWIESESVHLVYELATPQTFTITKEQIITLLGQNYVSHDGGGNIKVVYIRDLDITINDLINRVTALENE